jgi:hypothetical protein
MMSASRIPTKPSCQARERISRDQMFCGWLIDGCVIGKVVDLAAALSSERSFTVLINNVLRETLRSRRCLSR